MLSLKDRLQPQGNEVAAKVMDDEAIIINLANGIYYSMDRVGASIWEMIEGKHSLDEIITTTVARYDVSPEQAQADIERRSAGRRKGFAADPRDRANPLQGPAAPSILQDHIIRLLHRKASPASFVGEAG